MSDDEHDKTDEKKQNERPAAPSDQRELETATTENELHLKLKERSQRNRRHIFRLRARGQH